MQETSSSAIESLRTGSRVVAFGIAAIVLILLAAAVFLFLALPDANAFNARVEQIFVENDDLRMLAEIKLLEIIAQSGTAFQEVFTSYRMVILVLLVFSTALLLACLVFLVTIVTLNRRISAIQRSGIEVSSMLISREARAVYINDLEFKLTEASLETLAVLAEARLDDEVLTGAQIEAVISGRDWPTATRPRAPPGSSGCAMRWAISWYPSCWSRPSPVAAMCWRWARTPCG